MNFISIIFLTITFFCAWAGVRKTLEVLFPGLKDVQYNTALSLIHALIAVICGLNLFITGEVDNQSFIYPHLFSLTYFLHDCLYCWTDPIFLCHHLCSICMILMTRYLGNEDYNYMSNLLVIFAEITAIPQNHFFLMKAVYGDERKVEFNSKYYGEFKLFSLSFKICRLFIIPTILTIFLFKIKEKFYFWTLLVNCLAIICGSIYWLRGQKKLLQRMRKKRVLSSHSVIPIIILLKM
jgi:hypothetical protein